MVSMPKKEVYRKQFTPHRDTYILSQCEKRRVLHIGAADWPFTQEKYDDGSLLYKQIDSIALEQLGVDSDEESVALLNSLDFENSNILVQDFNTPLNIEFIPERIILGETLEHLMNLEIALSNLKKLMGEETILIISVPNATYALNFAYALFGSENQHPDHSVAFTYKTLSQLLEKNDFKIQHFLFTTLSSDTKRLNWKGRFSHSFGRIIGTMFPMLAPNLLVVVMKNNE